MTALLFDVLVAATAVALLAPACVVMVRLVKQSYAWVIVTPLVVALSVVIQVVPAGLLAGLAGRGHSYLFVYVVFGLLIVAQSIFYTTAAAMADGADTSVR